MHWEEEEVGDYLTVRAWTPEDTHEQARALFMSPIALAPEGLLLTAKRAVAKKRSASVVDPGLSCPSLCCLYAAKGSLSMTDIARLSAVARAWRGCGLSRLEYLYKLKELFVFDVPLFSEQFAWHAMSRGAAFPLSPASRWYWPSKCASLPFTMIPSSLPSFPEAHSFSGLSRRPALH